ncbi:MAG: hypothetical protein JXK95_05470, partial [Bacteroidales bacterium]|nr:hypothetical protein [Bacteroidales bacterium]
MTTFFQHNSQIFRRCRRAFGLIVSMLWFCCQSSFSQSIGDYGSNASGNWSTTGNWVICVADGTWAGATPAVAVPGAGNNVWIRAGNTITVNASYSCNNLVTEHTAILITIEHTFTVNGTFINAGTFQDNNSSGTNYFYGKVNNEVTGLWDTRSADNSSDLQFGNGLEQKNTTANSFQIGGARFTTNSQTIEGAGPISFSNSCRIGTTGITVTNNNTGVITLNDIFDGSTSVTATWINGSNSTIVYNSNAEPFSNAGMVLDLSSNENTFIYDYAGDQNIKDIDYYHLEFSGSGIKTLTNNLTVKGDLTVSDGVTLNSDNYDINLSGDWNNNSITDGFTQANSNVVYNGTTAQFISCAVAVGETLYDVSISNTAGVSLSCDLTVEGTLTLNANCCINLAGHTLNANSISET